MYNIVAILLFFTLLFSIPAAAHQTCANFAHTNWQGVLNSKDGDKLFTKLNISQTQYWEMFEGSISFNLSLKTQFPITYENSDCAPYPHITFVTDPDQGCIIFWGTIDDAKMYACAYFKGKDYTGYLYKF